LRAISVFRQHGHNNGRQNTAAGKTCLKTFKNRHSKALANGKRYWQAGDLAGKSQR